MLKKCKMKIMKMPILLVLLTFSLQPCISQNNLDPDAPSNLPYERIPDYPEAYNPGNILSRFMDGLGYRYYWATEGLTAQDLAYKPSEEARTTRQTLEHIHGLTSMIRNAAKNEPNNRQSGIDEISFSKLREQTLNLLKEASEIFAQKSEREIARLKVIFGSGGAGNEYPFWNMINGPISDALYHTGQVVSFRRASGNPVDPGVNVFLGITGN